MLATTVYLGKKGYDALTAAQSRFDDTSPAVKPVEPEVADQMRAATVLASER